MNKNDHEFNELNEYGLNIKLMTYGTKPKKTRSEDNGENEVGLLRTAY